MTPVFRPQATILGTLEVQPGTSLLSAVRTCQQRQGQPSTLKANPKLKPDLSLWSRYPSMKLPQTIIAYEGSQYSSSMPRALALPNPQQKPVVQKAISQTQHLQHCNLAPRVYSFREQTNHHQNPTLSSTDGETWADRVLTGTCVLFSCRLGIPDFL